MGGKERNKKYGKQLDKGDSRNREIEAWEHTRRYICQHPELQRRRGTDPPFCIRYVFNAIPLPSPDALPLPRRAGAIAVENNNSFSAAQALVQQHPGETVAVLNMASDAKPGGGVARGARAQEENLARRSNLVEMLDESHYPLPPMSLLYSPRVTVFKGADYALLSRPFECAVISCAALRHPPLDASGFYAPAQRNAMAAKVRSIVHVAIAHGVRHLVLGAFGCGAFGNPPEQVATLFAECLIRDGLRAHFDTVHFAVLVTRPDEQINLLAFQQAMLPTALNSISSS